jgi:8-oxo-dGTP pyrophosphatase MutT (NUDIX family)
MAAWAAGVLPVAVDPVTGAAVVLLGLDARSKGGRWSDFAGGGEPCDATPRATAVRELAEETGGLLVMRPADLDGALELGGKTPSGKTLHRFVVAVPYDVGLPARFRRAKDDEKTALWWFPLDALPRMRRVFEAQMRADGPAVAEYAYAFAFGGCWGGPG